MPASPTPDETRSDPAAAPGVPRLALEGIVKSYGSLRANDGISLEVMPGEIHALLGENGAGKSTLMKIVYGVIAPDAGTVRIDGQPVALRSPRQARAHGVAMVFQHFSLFETLSVAQNVWLGLDESMPLAQVTERIRAVAEGYGLPIDPMRPVHSLSVGERQRVEIVRALLTKPRLLILDEPTSVLTPQAVERLLATLRKLAAEGCAILYISHKLQEIRALCQRCTVLRHGRVTGTVDPSTQTDASLSALMIGTAPPTLARRPAQPAGTVLRIQGLSLPPSDTHGTALHDIHLELRAGEVVGIAGVSGNGQAELLRVLSGEDRRAPAGSIRLVHDDIAAAPPARRRALGMRQVPEERLDRGAVPSMSLAHNTLLTRREAVLPGGLLDGGALRETTARILQRFQVKADGVHAAARSLSGGNLQKYIVGREIDAGARVLVVAQPTWGVDVGAAARLRAELLAQRDGGVALLVISEDLDELFELADRMHVIAGGRLSPSIDTADATIETIGRWMGGQWPGAEASGAAPAARGAA